MLFCLLCYSFQLLSYIKYYSFAVFPYAIALPLLRRIQGRFLPLRTNQIASRPTMDGAFAWVRRALMPPAC